MREVFLNINTCYFCGEINSINDLTLVITNGEFVDSANIFSNHTLGEEKNPSKWVLELTKRKACRSCLEYLEARQ